MKFDGFQKFKEFIIRKRERRSKKSHQLNGIEELFNKEGEKLIQKLLSNDSLEIGYSIELEKGYRVKLDPVFRLVEGYLAKGKGWEKIKKELKKIGWEDRKIKIIDENGKPLAEGNLYDIVKKMIEFKSK